MEQYEVDGFDELPHFCGDTDSDQETTNMEYDGLNELPYFYCSDRDLPSFCCKDSDVQLNEETDDLEHDGIDRISDMPDYVLCKILCFMPIKNAMAAKVLSTRWLSLFPFPWIPPVVINLGNSSFIRDNRVRVHGYSPSMNFEIFADKLFNEMLINVPCLDVLNLMCNGYYSDEKKLSWVSAALRLNVRELSVQMYVKKPEDFFHLLNGYTGLERLEFPKGTFLNIPNDFTLPNLITLVPSPEQSFCSANTWYFPNLKTLILSEVRIFSSDDVGPLTELISRCLTLEILSLRHCHFNTWGGLSFSFPIKCPSLKNLIIEDCKGIYEFSLEIDAPKLQLLFCKGLAAKSYTVSNPLDSILSAHIDVEFPYSAHGAVELVSACSSAVDLYLCAFLLEALHHARAQLPIFKTLNQLALGYIKLDGWVMLARLLWNSPNLGKLVFKQGFCLQDGGYSSFESLMTTGTSPPCLELHVKEIVFVVFDEKEDEIKLVEYFMKNGKAVEALELHCLPFKNERTRERLSMLPRQLNLVLQSR